MFKINHILDVKTQTFSYPIIIGERLLQHAEELIRERLSFSRCAIITNETIYEIYKDKLNIDAEYVILKDGEEYKNIESYKFILDNLLKLNLERNDIIIAFGGGVVGDIAGFCAATYLRGVRFVQIPTTLLAQVDSSVGGKVAINHEIGKNLIGAFWQPSLVLSDVDALKTLDTRQLKTGLGEVVKYALIEKTCNNQFTTSTNKETLFEFLKNNKNNIFNLSAEALSELIFRCCQLKASVVNVDEKEQGLRAILNYGHTFAHSIEKCSEYKLFTHGEAVGLGMKMALELSLNLNKINTEYFDAAMSLIDEYELGDVQKLKQANLNTQELMDTLAHDKKVQNNKIRFVLSTALGECNVDTVNDIDGVKRIFEKYAN